jgi:hypothetical protein
VFGSEPWSWYSIYIAGVYVCCILPQVRAATEDAARMIMGQLTASGVCGGERGMARGASSCCVHTLLSPLLKGQEGQLSLHVAHTKRVACPTQGCTSAWVAFVESSV